MNIIKLNFACGLVHTDNETDIQTLMEYSKIAVEQAEKKYMDTIRYEALSDTEKAIETKAEFEDVVSIGYTKNMGLVSVALNLFDRAGSIYVPKGQSHFFWRQRPGAQALAKQRNASFRMGAQGQRHV